MAEEVDGVASPAENAEGNDTGAKDVSKPTWIEQLPEAMRTDETLYSHKTIGDLVKAHKAVLSERDGMIRVPGEKATPEEKAAFYKALEVPEKPEDYKLERPKGLSKDFPYDQSRVDAFKEAFHKAGISAKNAQMLVDSYYSDISKQLDATNAKLNESITKDLEEATSKLKSTWGDKYDENNVIAQRAVEKLSEVSGVDKITGGLSLVDYFKREGMANDPVLMLVLHAVGTQFMDDGTNFKGSGGAGVNTSREAVAKRLYPDMRKK